MKMSYKVIRNFIYMDIDSLYSLYSQVFEGVAEQIISQSLNSLTSAQNVSEPDQYASLDTKLAEASLKTESTILYDHMYNRLEEAIGDAIEVPTEIDQTNYREKLSSAFLVKATGPAEIEDYERVRQFTLKFNEICDGIAYASFNSIHSIREFQETIPLEIQKLKLSLRKTKSNVEKFEIRQNIEKLEKMQDPKELARFVAEAGGSRQDPTFIAIISNWMETFYPNGFEITINPTEQSNGVVFRGILDKKFLRLKPEYLRALYGGFVNADWVIVGQVTYLPGELPDEYNIFAGSQNEKSETDPQQLLEQVENPGQISEEEENPSLKVDIETSSETDSTETKFGAISEQLFNHGPTKTAVMRDPIRGLFKNAATFDRMFFESEKRVEVLLKPLAIYQEVKIPTAKK